jgi:pyruvate-formate lyase
MLPAVQEGEDGSRAESLQMMLDEVFSKGGQHLSLNIVDKEALLHALDHPFDSGHALVVCQSGYQVVENMCAGRHLYTGGGT